MSSNRKQIACAIGIVLVGVVALQLALPGAAMAASVAPVLFNTWQSGDAASECAQAGGGTNCGDFAYKVDDWGGAGMDGTYQHAGNTITISHSTGATFDWASVYPVCAVIVKGGPVANVYYYPGGAYSDTGLIAPVNPNNNKNYDISHVSFCFSKNGCYQEETAWAVGNRYVTRGNWAMYVAYQNVEKTVDIRAGGGNGVGMLAGTATFSTPLNGYVTIVISLTNGFIFYYDPNDVLEDHNLKVQDYAMAPTTTPSPGRFAWKAMIPVGSTTGTITVPANSHYGVHLDVAYPVPCQ